MTRVGLLQEVRYSCEQTFWCPYFSERWSPAGFRLVPLPLPSSSQLSSSSLQRGKGRQGHKGG